MFHRTVAIVAILLIRSAAAQTAAQATINFFYSSCNGSGCATRVPNGVTSMTIEAWGGGGGGDTTGGGQGGSYLKAVLSVTPGIEYNVSVGAGGNIGASGGSTFVNYFGSPGTPAAIVTAMGGAAGGSVAGGFSNSAATGTVGSSNPFYFIGCVGQPGTNTPAPTFIQTNPTAGTLLGSSTGGRGGDACMSEQTGGSGANQLAFATTTGSFVLSVQHLVTPGIAATPGAVPGGGGGGGTQLDSGSGAPGAPGYVLITYNLPSTQTPAHTQRPHHATNP